MSVYKNNLTNDLFKEDNLNSFVKIFDNHYTNTESKQRIRNGEILKLRFLKNNTLQSIGDIYGLSRERIRQIIHRNIRQLKHPFIFKDLNLKEFLINNQKEIFEIIGLTINKDQNINYREIKKRLMEYKSKELYGYYDLLLHIYFGNLRGYVISVTN